MTLPPVYTLRQLNAHFVKRIPKGFKRVKTLGEAQGIWYLCPVCYHKNNGDVGTHYMLHWFADRGIKTGWNPSGTGIDDLTFVGPGPVSVNAIGHWHGFIEHGTVRVDSVTPPQASA